ncbi:MAG: transaldolase family protein [Phycisphaerales bacterium]|nr:MAG: transaldolase family protein [Phycisphaerales bacterium]
MPKTDTIAGTVHEISRKGFTHQFGAPQVEVGDDPTWAKVRDVGTRLWLDTGDIEIARNLWCSQFEALTTNNTLLNKEIQKGIYDDLIKDAASAIRGVDTSIDERRLVLEVAFVLNAYHALRLVELFDAYVSVELHTDLADDVERSVAYGKRYYQICPERFIVKVPLTPAGLLAARALGERGVPVNFTLGFSARQNYVAALFAQPRYVNVFMGRLNAFVADNELGDGTNVGEKATLATQRSLDELRRTGMAETQLIGASMREGSQVATLAGIDVYTMPPGVAADYREHPAKTISRQVQSDPAIDLATGISLSDFNASTLWDVPDGLVACVEQLLKKDVASSTPEDIQVHFARAGFADFLPRWSDEDIQTVTADGKIPVFDKWKDRLAAGEIGMDALMNVSALRSFATDQQALDDRIRSLI